MSRAWIVAPWLLAACGELAPDGVHAQDAAPLPACTATTPELLASTVEPHATIDALVVHDSDIVWTEGGNGATRLRRAPKTGGPVTPLASCMGLTLDGDVAFCIALDDGTTATTTLLRVPLDRSSVASFDTGVHGVYRIVASDGALYLADGSTIWTMSETGGTPTVFASGPHLALFQADHVLGDEHRLRRGDLARLRITLWKA